MSGELAAESARTFRQALVLAASMAMVASALEFLAHGIVYINTDRALYQGLDVIWAKPLANLVAIVPVALFLRRFSERLFLAALAFTVIASPLLVLRPGSPLPLLILAAGIATHAGAFVGRAHRRHVIVRTGAVLAGSFAGAALATQAVRFVRERQAPGAAAAPAGSPNVLLVILDTVRGASLSPFGGRAATPHLDSVAATGVAFDRAVSPSSWTLPSHASMFTGLWPYQHGADWHTTLDDRVPTLAEALAAAGYRTGGFAANLIFTSREHGLDRGFHVYRDYRRTPGAILRASTLCQAVLTSRYVRRVTRYHDIVGRKYAQSVNREFLDWAGRDVERPWFAFLNYFDAHEPFLPRPPFKGQYSAGLPPRRFDRLRFWTVEGGMSAWDKLQPGEVEAERAAYEESIAGLDADLGSLLAELRRRGDLENTLVIITSDHGEQFGEHEAHSHGNSLHWRSIHVPLVVSWPGHLPAGERVTAPVSLRDLPSTILDLAAPGAAKLPGTPLLGPQASSASPLVLSELSRGSDPEMRRGALQSVVGADWLYIRSARGVEDAYRIAPDWSDSLITDSLQRVAVIDSGRSLLTRERVPSLKYIP